MTLHNLDRLDAKYRNGRLLRQLEAKHLQAVKDCDDHAEAEAAADLRQLWKFNLSAEVKSSQIEDTNMRARVEGTDTRKKDAEGKEAMRKALVKHCRDVLGDDGATDEEKEKARLMLRAAGEDVPDERAKENDGDDDEPDDSRDGEAPPRDEKSLARAIAAKMGGAPRARGLGSGNLSEARRILARGRQ